MTTPFYTGQIPTAADFNALAVKTDLAAPGGAATIGYGSTTVAAALAAVTAPLVTSVAGRVGDVVLTASDVSGVATLNGNASQNFSVATASGPAHAVPLAQADLRYAPFGSGGPGSGTVVSVGLSLPADFTVSGSPVTTNGVLTAVRASQTAKYFLAAPVGAAGVPVYRPIAAADIPTLNQNTSGTAAGLSTTLAIGGGGTGQTTAQLALNALCQVSAATNEWVLTKDTATGNAIFKAATGSGTSNFVAAGTGAATRTMQNKVRESVSLLDFTGADPTGVTNSNAAATNFATALPGNAGYINAGKYLLTGTAGTGAIHLYYTTGGRYAYDGSPMASLYGAGPQNSILNPQTTNMYAIQASSVAATCVMEVTYKDFCISGRGNLNNPNGIYLEVVEMMTLENLRFEQLKTGIYANSVEYMTFRKCFFEGNVNGIIASLGVGGFTTFNAGVLEECLFDSNSANGLWVTDNAATLNIKGGSFANNGTMGVGGTAAVNVTMTGALGQNGVNIEGIYFEGNHGDADILLTNTGARPVVCTVTGCNFNRVDNLGYTTNNIKTVGPIILILMGNTFAGYNSYVPSAARPYLNVSATTTVIPIGCSYSHQVEAAHLVSQSSKGGNYIHLAIDLGGHSIHPVTVLPKGWTAAYLAQGQYRITHNLNSLTYFIRTQVMEPGYAVMPPSITAYQPNYFDVSIRNPSGAGLLDCSLSISVDDLGFTS